MKATIRIEVDTDETADSLSEILDTAKDVFFESATSICVESEDGTSETIYTRKK